MVLAALGSEPLVMGLASVTKLRNGNWEKNCKAVTYEAAPSQESDGSLFAVSANGEFIAIGFGNDSEYLLKVWRAKDLTELASKTLPSIPLDMEFSDSGDELYVLLGDSLKVMSIKRDPFR